jgi:hypothetical protein
MYQFSVFLTAADFVGGVFFQGSKKGKKVQKEQKRNLFAIFAPFLHFLLPKKEPNHVIERAHKGRCGEQFSVFSNCLRND